MLALHVDDLILAYQNDAVLAAFIQFFAQDDCKMNDLGEVSQFIGVEIHRNRSAKQLKIVQAGYVDQILDRFDMTSAHPRHIPLDPGTKFSRSDVIQQRLNCNIVSRTSWRHWMEVHLDESRLSFHAFLPQ
jgi:hypothetical protein